jgi:hypothetical protein
MVIDRLTRARISLWSLFRAGDIDETLFVETYEYLTKVNRLSSPVEIDGPKVLTHTG